MQRSFDIFLSYRRSGGGFETANLLYNRLTASTNHIIDSLQQIVITKKHAPVIDAGSNFTLSKIKLPTPKPLSDLLAAKKTIVTCIVSSHCKLLVGMMNLWKYLQGDQLLNNITKK